MYSNTLPSPGDIVVTDRGLYKHYGVYIDRGQVIHFAGPKGHETDPNLATIIHTSIDDFHKGDDLFIERDSADFIYKPFPPKEIIKRAKSKLVTGWGKYNLEDHNCEHFANWCKYDVEFSRQVEKVASTIVKVTKPLLLLLYLFSSDANEEKILSFGMEDVVRFFKSRDRFKLLQSNPSLIPVVGKAKNADGSHTIYCCIYNKKTSKIVDDSAYIGVTSCIRDDLRKAFGKKNMIILE